MQIREKGKKLLMIRTEYSPEHKRTFGKTVASQDIGLSTVSDEVRQQLTEEEVDQLEKWLSERTKKQAVDSAEISLSTIATFVGRATKALSVDEAKAGLSQEKAAEIYAAMDELAKALRKAGFKKPKAPRQAAPKKDERQLDLTEESAPVR